MNKICARKEDFSRWYNDVIAEADLAEHAPVRGCMVIKPYGYALWEMMQKTLDDLIKAAGAQNAYFPLFIPESFLKLEAEHVEGFSPELAVVTHAGGKKLEEPLIVRPTSETIIYHSFSKWIQSYRDLPLLINQWANVVRWELRPRLFLRTTEFLWQEGHTAHSSQSEADTYALKILHEVYERFAADFMAMPVYTGVKSESEKFAGAFKTYCIEALMQDGKSLQAGTSHNLADNFSKSFDVAFLNDRGEKQFAHQTSWGASTRLIGGLIMTHGDDKGLILPPKIAPIQIVVIPVSRSDNDEVVRAGGELANRLKSKFRVHLDSRDLRPGEKYYEWEKKGVPLRIELGPRDLAERSCVMVRRDTGEKLNIPLQELETNSESLLERIQQSLYENAQARRDNTKVSIDRWNDFTAAIEKGGYVFAHWCEDPACEAAIKEKTKAVSRCLRFDEPIEPGEHACVNCGQITKGRRWTFAKAY